MVVLRIICWAGIALLGALNAWRAHKGDKCDWMSYFCLYFVLVSYMSKWGF